VAYKGSLGIKPLTRPFKARRQVINSTTDEEEKGSVMGINSLEIINERRRGRYNERIEARKIYLKD
jgi:hypothetical protein